MFSEKQIGEVANEQLVDKDLKVKTLEQTEANWSEDFSGDDFGATFPTGLEVTYSYRRISRINGELHIVLLFKIKNPTESSISVGNSNNIQIKNIPENIASLIYDVEGDPLSEDVNDIIPISACYYYTDSGTPTNGMYAGNVAPISRLQSSLAPRGLRIALRNYPSVSAGATHNVLIRTSFTLV